MENYVVKILDTEYLNDDVKRIVLEKPAGYTFIPGQSVWVSINTPNLVQEKRSFTFTGLNKWQHLELMVKINPHPGSITYQLDYLKTGDELIISKPWGTIQYKGDGVFIAAGSGITPFIAILRQLKEDKQIKGDSLIFSNQMETDLFLDEELTKILKDRYYKIYTRQFVVGFREHRIDLSYLKKVVRNFNQHFYICGPREFVENIMKLLTHMGISLQTIIFEKKATGIISPPDSDKTPI